MPREQAGGEPTTRRYSAEEKASAVGMVRMSVKQDDVDDGLVAGLTTSEARRVWELEQENLISKLTVA